MGVILDVPNVTAPADITNALASLATRARVMAPIIMEDIIAEKRRVRVQAQQDLVFLSSKRRGGVFLSSLFSQPQTVFPGV